MEDALASEPPSPKVGERATLATVPYDETVARAPPVPVTRPPSPPRHVDANRSAERQEQEQPDAASGTATATPDSTTTAPKVAESKEKVGRPRAGTPSRSRPNLTFGRRKTQTATTEEQEQEQEQKQEQEKEQEQEQEKARLKSPSVPSIVVDEVRPSSRMSDRVLNGLRGRRSEDKKSSIPAVPPLPPVESFQGISLDIPSASFDDLKSQINRKDSVRRDGQSNGVDANNNLGSSSNINNSNNNNNNNNSLATPSAPKADTRRVPSSNSLAPRPPSSASRAISVDEEVLSRKVRLLYERGDAELSDAELNRLADPNNEVLWEQQSSVADDATDAAPTPNNNSTADLRQSSFITPPQLGQAADRNSCIIREEQELAGGIEDWDNVQNEEVDRYGFIIRKTDNGDGESDSPQPLKRVTSNLMAVSSMPRRKRTLGGGQSSGASIRSFSGRSLTRKSTEQTNRPSTSLSSHPSSASRSSTKLRYATNRLPHRKDRRLMDEAVDMLTLPGSLGSVPDDDTPYARTLKKKEWEREEKWRKMAKITSKSGKGAGMSFEFDIKSPKLIERTWKGIPDSWRATAWHAFLSTSAEKRKGSPTDEQIVQKFKDLQDESSPDDVQIDIDVPRTISDHIMFRRRYRGGQRLLFRILHAMSLYFPETGYVQGMATLAATLLAYYDEERAFIMLVRLWQLRGLDRLYRAGFTGLMEALENFEKDWLDGGEVAEKLVCLPKAIISERIRAAY